MDPKSENYYGYSTYGYVRNNPLKRIDPNGMTDWEVVGRGSLTLLGGVVSIVGAAAITPTGIGVPAAAYLGIQGVAASSFGLTQIVAGFAMDESNVKEKAIVKNMPTSLVDGACMAADGIAGNKNGEIRTVGQVVDLGLGLAAGKLSNLAPLLGSVNTANATQKGMAATTVAQSSLLLYDNTAGSTKKTTTPSKNESKTKQTNQQEKPKQEVKKPANLVELRSQN